MPKRSILSEDGSSKLCSNPACSKPGQFQPLDSFHRRKLKSGGFTFQSWCRECARAAALECANAKYANDPAWREAKLAADRGRKTEERAAHRAAHPRVRLTPEQREANNRAAGSRYYKTPKGRERHRTQERNRRALTKLAAAGQVITTAEWNAVLEAFGHRCAYCTLATSHLEMDHVIPLTRGGAHSLDNILPACRACNTEKNDRTPCEWQPSRVPQIEIRSEGGRGAWKLTDAQVSEIRARRAAGESGRDVACFFGVSIQYVSDIVCGRKRVIPV